MTNNDRPKDRAKERETPGGRKQGKEDSVITIQPRHRPGECHTSDTKRESSKYPGDVNLPR